MLILTLKRCFALVVDTRSNEDKSSVSILHIFINVNFSNTVGHDIVFDNET